MRRSVLSLAASTVLSAGLTNALLFNATPAHAQDPPLRLTWVDRTGKATETVGSPGAFRGLDLSTDGKRVAVHRHDGFGGDIWLQGSRGDLTRLTTDVTGDQENASPVLSPDGSRIVFASLRNHRWGIYVKRADGTGGEELLIESGSRKMPMSWSPDGQSIIYWVQGGTQWILTLSRKQNPQPLLDAQSSHAQISPDGRWVAYNSLGQIFVKPFTRDQQAGTAAATGEAIQVSNDGGAFSRWRGDGKELFFMDGTSGQMMAAEVDAAGPSLKVGTPRPLFEHKYINLGHPSNYHTFSVSPDGQRFLIPRPEPETLTLFDRQGREVKTLGRDTFVAPTLSPDGTRVAVIRNRDVWVIDTATGADIRITSVAPTARVLRVVWAPDGRQIAYLLREVDREVIYRKDSHGEGREELVYRLPGFNIFLNDWSQDGRSLVYTSASLAGSRVFALPLTNEPKPVEVMRSGIDTNIAGARVSPDGRFVAYRLTDAEKHRIWVSTFDMADAAASDRRQVTVEATLDKTVGMLWWRRDGRELYFLGPNRQIMAVDVRATPFEVGKPRALFTAPDAVPDFGNADQRGSVSSDGERVVLVIPPVSPPPPNGVQQITLFDRQGKIVRTVGAPGRYGMAAVSPDGTRIAVRRFDVTGRNDIWSFDIASGKSIAITDDAAPDFNPLWSRDGRQILYVSQRPGGYSGIYRKQADGSGAEELLFRHAPGSPITLRDVSPDGKFLVFDSGAVLMVVPLTGTDPLARKAIEFSREEYNVFGGRFSPDGRYLAYSSDESKTSQLYVRPFDSSTGAAASTEKWQASKDGAADFAVWRADGRELYFVDTAPDLVMMSVEVSTTPAFQLGTPKALFHLPGDAAGALFVTKYISNDGQQFVFILPVQTKNPVP